MYTIFEQGSGRGIGLGIRTFVDRFADICCEHETRRKTRSFAFIFYDFTNQAIKRILKDQGVFTKLDRLAGSQLSIFYLHAKTREVTEAFNSYFLTLLGVKEQARLPCLVFFRVKGEEVTDVEVAQLDSMDLIHGFDELYGAVESFINDHQAAPAANSGAITWSGSAAKVIHLDDFRDALKKSL